ncbi:MAG: nucleotidyltransferase family protein [Longimicrobiales bacterium]
MELKIRVPVDRIRDFCRSHGIRKLELFGSVLTDGFNDDSDVDVMVEFLPGRTPGLAFFTLADELAEIIGRRVDLLTRQSVEQSENYIFRREALARVHTLYEAA